MDWENNRIVGFAADAAQAAFLGLRRQLVKHPYVFEHRTIADETLLSEGWAVLKPDSPLMPDGDDQIIFLRLADPFIWRYRDDGVSVPGGSLVIPEVEIVDFAGGSQKLEQNCALGEHLVGYKLGALSGVSYVGVNIRTPKPVKLENVLWSTYWRKNLK